MGAAMTPQKENADVGSIGACFKRSLAFNSFGVTSTKDNEDGVSDRVDQ